MFGFVKNRDDELSNHHDIPDHSGKIKLPPHPVCSTVHGSVFQLPSVAHPSGNFTKVTVKADAHAGVIRAHLLGVCINGSHGRPNRHKHGRDSCGRT